MCSSWSEVRRLRSLLNNAQAGTENRNNICFCSLLFVRKRIKTIEVLLFLTMLHKLSCFNNPREQ